MDTNTPFDFAASSCSREACDVRFTYYSPEELRAITVDEIMDVPAFDEWGETMDQGLYAPAMGSLSIGLKGKMGPRPCKTCGLEKDCPGHMGRIELATPVYNPFIMPQLYKLLNQTCLKCKRLKADPSKSAELIRTLKLLAPGEFAATEKHTEVLSGRKRALNSDVAPDESAKRIIVEAHPAFGSKDQDVKFYVESMPPRDGSENLSFATTITTSCEQAAQDRAADASSRAANAPEVDALSGSALEACRAEIQKFLKDLPNNCGICKLPPSKWRKEGHSQLFVRRAGERTEALVKPGDVRIVVRQLFQNDKELLRWLVPGARELGADVFFLETIAVPPNRFRPPGKSSTGGPPTMARQTSHLHAIIKENTIVRDILAPGDSKDSDAKPSKASKEDVADEDEQPPSTVGELEKHIQFLQLAVNSFMDSGKSEQHPKMATPGLRQEFEKKQGIFRMKMMGKRVNFAARSVISPDLNIETSEIGVPQAIAEGLQYPEVATTHNAEWLRNLVERGPRYPGATEVHIPQSNGSKEIKSLYRMTEEARRAIAKQLITDIDSGKAPMTVFRHLRTGDPLLVNRQPTLHKPGIMAHTARVLRKESTIRLHYVNCNTYNADFDGDEMNLHAPQDPIGRMEALSIARADKQYLVPTSGKPLRGLIQDHVIAGTMLCKRDTYFDKHDVCLVLYAGLRAAFDGLDIPLDGAWGRPWVNELESPHSSTPVNGGRKIRAQKQQLRFKLDDPTIRKPHALWSGKQVFSMLLKNILDGYASRGRQDATKGGVNLKSKSKTPGDIWNGKLDGNTEEANVIFQDSDLLTGVMDKNQFGASMFGIIHLLYELAGGHVVGVFLASIARVFSLLLQKRGFTCAFRDLLLTDEAEWKRLELIVGSRTTAKKTIEAWLKDHDRHEVADGNATNETLSETAHDLMHNTIAVEKMEGMLIGKMKESWTDMINKTIPVGQKLPFPLNNFSAMVQTGAKGSKVNQSQITCCLGQQELEGRLVPLTATKKSLPCFAPYDLTSRTRGYITDRFLTGIRPQEYFFHCMAGREGLVDTAVKTSRSGYLQRCLIKHLECLKVGYDMTVRDSDGSVVQFLYGEDGQDVTRASYLFKFDELRENFHMLRPASERQLAQLQANPNAVDFGSAGLYLLVQRSVEQGKYKRAVKTLDKLLEQQLQVQITGFRELANSKANGIYTTISLEDEPKVVYMKSEGDPMFICWDGKWYIGPDANLQTAYATKRGPQTREALLKEGVWEGRHCVETQFVKVRDAATLSESAQQSLRSLRAQVAGLLEQSPEKHRKLVVDPVSSILSPAHCFASTSEKHEAKLTEYLQKATEAGMSEEEAKAFADFMRLKFLKTLAEPGEAVGVIAGQSMGEPSTQMTLNTFHLAGHGGANVTLGIPRLREIIQTGSKSCATPLMKVKVLKDEKGRTDADSLRKFAERIQYKFRRVTIMDLLARLTVHDSIRYINGHIYWTYQCRFEFLPLTGINKKIGHIDEARVEGVVRGHIIRKLKAMLKRVIGMSKLNADATSKKKKAGDEEGEAVGGGDDDEENAKAPAEEAPKKKKKQKTLGAEDKAEKQMNNMDEEEADDDDSESSGMYSGEENEDRPDREKEAELHGYRNLDEEEEEEARKAAAADDDGEGDEEGEDGKTKKRKKAVEDSEGSDDEEAPAKRSLTEKGFVKTKAQRKTEEKLRSGEVLLQTAIASGELVWHTKLEGDTMTVVVSHKYDDCPHSLFVGEMIQEICRTAELQDPACEGVANVHVKEEDAKKGGSEIWLECEGINLYGLQSLPYGCVQHAGIYTNNIQYILSTYGVEAARTSVVKEVTNVFGHYGIDVDYRHLYLIADYMTQGGGMKAFNRHGMQNQMSPLLQMSYETTMQFLTAACQESLPENMVSPASSIVLGSVPQVGTGCVQLMVDLEAQEPHVKKRRQFMW